MDNSVPTQPPYNPRGDIILDPSAEAEKQKRASKRPWIVFGIVLLILIIVAVIILVITSQGAKDNSSNNPSNNSSTSSSLTSDFNKFANYLYAGEASDAKVDTSLTDYAFAAKLADPDVEVRTAYFDQADPLFDTFKSSFEASSYASDEDVKKSFDDLSSSYQLLSLVAKTSAPSVKSLLNIYQASGIASAKSNVSTFYQDFTSSNVDIIKTYGDNMIAFYSDVLDHVDSAKIPTCVNQYSTNSDIINCVSLSRYDYNNQADLLSSLWLKDDSAKNIISAISTLSGIINPKEAQ